MYTHEKSDVPKLYNVLGLEGLPRTKIVTQGNTIDHTDRTCEYTSSADSAIDIAMDS